MYLDGKAEKGTGQEATTPTVDDIPDAGKALSKSSLKVTIQFRIAGDEFLPPHIIGASTASKGRAKLHAEMFHSFELVVGQFGCSKKHPWQAFFLVNKSR